VTVGDGTVTREAHDTVTVYDVAPYVDAGQERTGVEGSPVAIEASFADPGTGGHTATIDWGDGTVTDGSVTGHDVTGEHAYADNGSYNVTVKVDDAGGATGSDTTTVDVQNAPPKVDAGTDATAPWGIPVAFVGTVTDPGSADTAAGLHPTWSFGDGSAPATGLATAHAYDSPGMYTATLSASDKDGGQAGDDVAVQIVRRNTTLDLDGYSATAVNARLTDVYDKPTAKLAGHDVVFELAGATYHANTDASGLATANLPTALEPATYTLTLRFAGDDLYASSQATTTLEVAVQATPGLVTGGALRSSANGRGGFNVHSDGVHIWGQLQYQSAIAGNFHASTMTSFVVTTDGRSARFAGIGADGRHFETYVEDNGEPGKRDVWRLWIDGRLETDGTLKGGNIQIHG
jgi:PKD domain